MGDNLSLATQPSPGIQGPSVIMSSAFNPIQLAPQAVALAAAVFQGVEGGGAGDGKGG